MGVFDFIKDVGEKLFGAGDDKSPNADAIKAEVEKLGLEAKDLKVDVQGDTVKVSGEAPSTSIKEKLILAMGNVLGVAKVEENIVAKATETSATFYTVKKGDTLWKISETNYGKGKGAEYNRIFEANKPMLKHPDKIYPGQVLRIPPLG